MSSAPLKAELRAQSLARRRLESAEAAAAFAARLAAEGERLAREKRPAVVSAYFALPEEASTLPLLKALSRAGFATALPVTGARGTPLTFRLWRPGEPMAKGKMGIGEPLPEAEEVDPDLLFTPLAAFDRAGNRIGYGAGFYDRSLAKLRGKKSICAIGVAYACQEIPKVPHEAHDERLDFVLTERELIECKEAET